MKVPDQFQGLDRQEVQKTGISLALKSQGLNQQILLRGVELNAFTYVVVLLFYHF